MTDLPQRHIDTEEFTNFRFQILDFVIFDFVIFGLRVFGDFSLCLCVSVVKRTFTGNWALTTDH